VLLLFFSATLSALLIMIPSEVGTWEQLLQVFRLAMFGDFEEIATHTDLAQSASSPVQSVQVVLLIFTSFLVAIVLLNVFIAMLCKNYELQYENAWPSFMRERARENVNVYAAKLGVGVLLNRCPAGPLRTLWLACTDRPALHLGECECYETKGAWDDKAPPFLWFSVSADSKDKWDTNGQGSKRLLAPML